MPDIWVLLWLFFAASFGGWVCEVAYSAMVHRRFQNAGTLCGPWCPQYGLMLVLPYGILLRLQWHREALPVILLCLASSFLVEFAFAWALRKFTGIRMRDYSKFRWNIKGYVSVPIVLVRALMYVLVILFIVPILVTLTHYIPRTLGWIVLLSLLGLLLLDIVISTVTITKLRGQFKRLAQLGQIMQDARNALGSRVSEGAIGTAEAIDDLDLDSKLRDAQRNAEESYTALLNKSDFFKRRFLMASSEMSSDTFEQELKDFQITTEQRHRLRAIRDARNRYEYEGTFENPEDRPFAFGMNLTKLFWIFLIGSVAGFVLEECWAFFIAHKIELRVGLVYGPFQPIYGGGAAIITLALYRLYKENSVVIFFASGMIGATFEYLCSYFQEMLFGTVSWDYSGTPFNVDGRTNLMFGVIWGLLGLIWLRTVYPALSRWIEKIPKRIGSILTIALFAFMLFDAFMSCAALTRANERANHIPATSSFQQFLDRTLDDDYLALVYPNMQHVNEDGSKAEKLKDLVE